jgi:predicted CopG family antitoxin
MKTLNISISDLEYNKFGLKNEKLSFSELLEIVNKEMQKLNLRKSVELAEKYGLAKLTTDEINDEIKLVRKNAKNRH